MYMRVRTRLRLHLKGGEPSVERERAFTPALKTKRARRVNAAVRR